MNLNYRKMKKAELVELARESGIRATGTKQDIIDRLERIGEETGGVELGLPISEAEIEGAEGAEDERPEKTADKEDDNEPEKKKVIPKKRTNEILPFRVMDRADDDMILSEMSGNIIDKFVYEFKDGGQTVVGLTVAGVNNTVRMFAAQGEVIRVEDNPKILEDEEYYHVVVKASRYKIERNNEGEPREILLDTSFGSKRQAKKYRARSGQFFNDTFAFEKAISKAQRNAKRMLIPEDFVVSMIKQYRGEGRVIELNAPKAIPESKRRYLLHLAGGKPELDRIIAKMGYSSTQQIAESDFDLIKRELETKQEEATQSLPEIPSVPVKVEEAFNWIEDISTELYPPAKRKAIWTQYFVKHKTIEKAVNAFISYATKKVAEVKI